MDEAILFFKGRIEYLRFVRQNTYLLHCSAIDSENRLGMLEALPLPFDSELEQQGKEQEEQGINDSLLLYEEAKKGGYI